MKGRRGLMKDIFYRCEVCGNMVALIKSGGGTLACCGQDMTKLVANTVDASQEKHVPDVKIDGKKIMVQVGSVEHPMVSEHYIEWIAIVTDNGIERINLSPGDEPKAIFAGKEGSVDVLISIIREDYSTHIRQGFLLYHRKFLLAHLLVKG